MVRMDKKQVYALRAQHNLPIYAKAANEHYHKAHTHFRGALEHAIKCGEMLVKARALHKYRGTWKKWLEDHFDGSYESAKVYMKIARRQNDPRLDKARKQGAKVDSIRSVLDVLSDKPIEPRKTGSENKAKPTEKELADSLRKDIGKEFANMLGFLCSAELEVMKARFDDYAFKWREQISNDTSEFLSFDIDEYVLEWYERNKHKLPTWDPKNRRDAMKGPSVRVVNMDMEIMEREARVQKNKELHKGWDKIGIKPKHRKARAKK